MFKKATTPVQTPTTPVERVTSVLGPGINWSGNLGGKGGIRIEGRERRAVVAEVGAAEVALHLEQLGIVEITGHIHLQ